MDETKLTADLPNLRMEISHRVAENGSGEMITIQLQAMPDFSQALPLLGSLAGSWPQAPLPFFAAPWAIWAQATQSLLAPWMEFAGANPFAALANDDFFGKFKK